MKERDQGEGARMGSRGRQGRAGRAGPDRAGLGRTVGQNPVARTTTDREINSRSRIRDETKQRTRLSTESDKEI
jgi:hypothetical protein